MKKISVIFLLIGLAIGSLAICNPSAEAADRWFFTGKDRRVGDVNDMYYVRSHEINDFRSICTVIKVNGSNVTTFVYLFNKFDAYGDASYSKRQDHVEGKEIDKGTLYGTVSPVVTALWNRIVLPDRQEYFGRR